jgi:hypothetical protein
MRHGAAPHWRQLPEGAPPGSCKTRSIQFISKFIDLLTMKFMASTLQMTNVNE